MTRYALLLRGVNVGTKNSLPMAELRAMLTKLGCTDVQTYVQSGNVVLSSQAKSETVRRQVEQAIADSFDLEIPVVVRTRAELTAVVKRNPLGKVATEPKRYQVSFLSGKLSAKVARELEETAAPDERVVVSGREVYAWHPQTIARSKLWAKLAGKTLGVTATSRNWTTVEALLALADKA